MCISPPFDLLNAPISVAAVRAYAENSHVSLTHLEAVPFEQFLPEGSKLVLAEIHDMAARLAHQVVMTRIIGSVILNTSGTQVGLRD
jgi:hypothetical protein